MMNETILPQIIAGVSVILAPILTLLIKGYIDNRPIFPIPVGRRQAITGRWEGTCHQMPVSTGETLDYSITADLIAGRKKVTGTFTIRYEWNDQIIQEVFNVTGGFFYSRFLRLNYLARDESLIQFGSVVLELDAAATVFDGRYVGYGALTGEVVGGTLRLEKL